MILDNKSCDYRNCCTYIHISDFQHFAVHLYTWFGPLFNDSRQHIEGLGQDEGRRRRKKDEEGDQGEVVHRSTSVQMVELRSTYSFMTPILQDLDISSHVSLQGEEE